MNIQMLGIDHSTAPVDIREKFAFTTVQSLDAMQKIVSNDAISGCIILSTCNRMEIWVSCDDDEEIDLYSILCGIKGVEEEKCK